MTDQIHDEVRRHYGEAALAVLEGGSCCSGGADEASPGASFYTALAGEMLPDQAVLASLGCGNPTAVAELREGERVLDLGSGGGLDVLLSAKRVGPTGRAFGLDMTDEMLALAMRNKAEAGATNVEFLKGQIESIPLPAASIDVVISNCVINLAADKGAVFSEIARVLRPGGRVGVADIVADDSLDPGARATLGNWAGCIAGALSFSEYRAGLEDAGLVDVAIEPTQVVASRSDGAMHSAIIRARKPIAEASATPDSPVAAAAKPDRSGSCCGGGSCCG